MNRVPGYRDDLEAALSRSALLEKALAESDERLEDKEQELAQLRARIATLEKSAADARQAAQGFDPPAPRPNVEPELPSSDDTLSAQSEDRWWEWMLFPFALYALVWETTGWLGKIFIVLIHIALIGLIISNVSDCLSRRAMNHQASVSWGAQVESGRGTRFTPGASCRVTALLASDHQRAFGPEELKVFCGKQMVYNWNGPIRLISGEDAPRPLHKCSTLRQQKTPSGAYRYQLSCADVKGRVGGRPEMSLETPSGQLNIWSETPPIFRLELKVDPWSSPISGTPLISGAEASQPGYW